MECEGDRFARLLRERSFTFSTEKELQDAIAATLDEMKIAYIREYHLSRLDIIDFYLWCSGIGIEVKIKGNGDAVVRQLMRYAECDQIKSLILVSSRLKHWVPPQLCGKPVEKVAVMRTFF